MRTLRYAVIGTGFWANYQVAAWKEVGGVELVAVYNRTRQKAAALAEKYSVPAVYDSVEGLFMNERLDFADIITDVDTHPQFTMMAADNGVSVICQKPMAPTFEMAKAMVHHCMEKNVPFFVHENFRWQAPIRALKKALDSGIIGTPFKGRISFCSAFPFYENQPFLAELDRFIIMDIGSHVLDICRFLFGEAASVFCLTKKVNPAIKGEDVANVLMEMKSGLHCFAEMSYASILEKETFPQTLALIEGSKGSIHLTGNFMLKTTTREGTVISYAEPVMYHWLDPGYAVVHSSIVDCNRDIANGLRGGKAENTGADNLKTAGLVSACYDSAATRQTIFF